MVRYLIDTSILISFDIFTPQKYHHNFWQELAQQVERGNIVVLDSIANECKNARLNKWIKQLQPWVVAVDDNIRQKALAINKQYRMITVDPTGQPKSVADTHLIAYANRYGLGIFSYETIQRDPQGPPKIPDVCRAMNIPYERFSSKVMRGLAFAKCS